MSVFSCSYFCCRRSPPELHVLWVIYIVHYLALISKTSLILLCLHLCTFHNVHWLRQWCNNWTTASSRKSKLMIVIIVTIRHGSAIQCCKGMNVFNGKDHFSGSCSSETLGPIFHKFDADDCVGDLTSHANFGSIGSKGRGVVDAHAWVCRRQASIFLGYMHIATDRPIVLINAVNGSNDVSWCYSHFFYGSKNKNLYLLPPPPSPNPHPPPPPKKIENLHCSLLRCLHRRGGFRGWAIYRCHSNLFRSALVAMVTNIYLFLCKEMMR